MYKNVSKKIQKMAAAVAIINIIFGIVLAVMGLTAASQASRASEIVRAAQKTGTGASMIYDPTLDYEASAVLVITGIMLAISGVFTSWIIYGFGQMTQDVSQLKADLSASTALSSKQADDISALRKIAESISTKQTENIQPAADQKAE
ncbi:MAG: hypothetical protein SOI44_07985 [Lactimicrobium sp.]|jgi:hypothetical protein|uniref:hypothetical protein n=1 Tax=Lactimicrobium sp. TaxID=2563780 RepID=UPI002F35B830